MKAFFTIFLLFVAAHLFSQSDPECAANADGDQIICYDEPIVLSAPFSQHFDEIKWSIVYGPPGSGLLDPNNYTTNVTGGPNWDPDVYTFRFSVVCKDLDGNGIKDVAYDDVVVTVMPDVTQPVITEPDANQDGHFTVCTEGDITVNAPAPGEMSSVSVIPEDGLVTTTISGNTVHLKRLDTNNSFQGNCDYVVTYVISNGGCTKKAEVNVTFIRPQYRNTDGIIEGVIDICPSCNDTLQLLGDRPGCGGQGIWTVASRPPGATANIFWPDKKNGDASAALSHPGIYTFQYTVDNIAPCPSSTFEISCQVLDTIQFLLGEDIYQLFCDNVLPAGVYNYAFNELDNAIYNWQILTGATNSEIGISPGNTHSATITVFNDLDLSDGLVMIEISAVRFFIDPDCDGPLPYHEVELPYNDPVSNEAYIQQLLTTPGICYQKCEDYAYIYFYGGPQVELEAEDVFFLCSDGIENVRLTDYFTVSGGLVKATVLSQPPGSNLPNQVSTSQLLQLSVDGCGEFVFRIEASEYNFEVFPYELLCQDADTLTITIEESKPVTAGTDQSKCCNEPIRLNGNNPYSCGSQGTWTLVSCSNGCTVTIDNPHDPNTQIFVNEDCSNMPVTLQFQWSFSSEESFCKLADTTVVYIDSCIIPCENLDVNVITECVEGRIILTAVDDNGQKLSPYTYSIIWTGNFPTQSGNPVAVQDPGSAINYTVQVTLVAPGSDTCNLFESGTAQCSFDTLYCGIRITERCDDCGNVILTAVDENGNPVPPTPFLHTFRWVVYGGPGDDSGVSDGYENVNPITVHAGACYSLLYEHFEYPPGAEPIPGTWTGICRYQSPIFCVSDSCPGPCGEFPDFFIAGCGDVLDLSLNLTFPPGCYNVCSGPYASATLGVFFKGTNNPVTGYDILWEDGSTGTYANGILSSINTVRISSMVNRCCYWEDGYSPICCDRVPHSVTCEQPITKYCKDDGTVTYVPGPPQISWYGVPGAIGYELKITFGDPHGCCEGSGETIYISVSSSPWTIPDDWDCFTISVRAIFPPNVCEQSNWSDPYTYCENVIACTPVITVCGCCHERSAEGANLPVRVIPEEEMLALLKANPGPAYATLREALTAIGFTSSYEPNFSIYPNPVSNVITIRPINAVSGNFQVQLHDMLHRQWRQREFDGGTEGTLDVGDLPNGIYLLSIRNTDGELLQTEKVIVMRQ
ncbi:MAG: T9SS C-terminal target domain-containing protein [Haliscomenobacteraceae bacterium CHB4]|nr:hypothetical protein [Saprospiraceae bacterium]MCE7923962.1 T9SS C-terminal target domain-containing protein [Haliscomenobacteraceae bacterium CHB4]